MPVFGKTQTKKYKMRLKMVSVRIEKYKTKKPFDFSKGFLKMVPRSGFEPMTYRLEEVKSPILKGFQLLL